MNSSKFLLELKNKLAGQDWPRVFLALRQDPEVWECLENSDLGERALREMPAQAEKWCPAMLALLALSNPCSADVLTSFSSFPLELPLELQRQANQAYSDWLKGQDAHPGLAHSGLLALALRERLRIDGSWAGLLAEVDLWSNTSKTTLACLFGMLADPSELLQGLLLGGGEAVFQPDLALHALLCNPLTVDAQLHLLGELLTGLSWEKGLELLRALTGQRPWMAVRLTREYLDRQQVSLNPWGEPGKVEEQPVEQLTCLADALRIAQAYQFAAQPERAAPLLAESLRVLRRLRGHLSAQLAQAAAQARNVSPQGMQGPTREIGLEAWKQAVQLVPEVPLYSVGLAKTWIETGHTAEAYSYLKGQVDSRPQHPALFVGLALASSQLGNEEEARQAALQALELAQTGCLLDPQNLIVLARFFQDQGMFPEVLETGSIAQKSFPLDSDMLELLAQAHSSLGHSMPAISNAYAALAIEQVIGQMATAHNASSDENLPPVPGRAKVSGDLQSLLVDNLEDAGEWGAALSERLALVAGMEAPTITDLQALTRSALRAGSPQQAIEACNQALVIDPGNALTHRLLAEAALMLGDHATAVEHYSQVTLLSPHLAETWLALAGVHKLAGQEAQALNALRAASQAVPNDWMIHLALGEAYLDEGALTQALNSVRRAASLTSSVQVDLRLGQTLLLLGYTEEAYHILEHAYQVAQGRIHTVVEGDLASELAEQPDPELIYAYAQALLGVGELPQAISLLKDVIQAWPEDPGPCLDMARALVQFSDQPAGAQRAIPFLQRVLEFNQDRLQASGSGRAAIGSGRYHSLSGLQAEAQALLAEAYAATGEMHRSMQAYQRALESPLNREAGSRLSFGLGLVALKLDQPETAVAALEDAAQTEPLSSRVQRALSEAYLASGLAEDAFQAALAARDLGPSDPDVLTWFVEQGLKLIEQPGATLLPIREEVIQALQSVAQLVPWRSDLLARLGKLYLESGDHQSAIEIFKKLAEDSEGQGVQVTDLYEAAIVLCKMDRAQLAVSLLKKAIDQNDGEAGEEDSAVRPADLYTELAIAHQQSGEMLEALEALERGIGFEPGRRSLHLRKADLLVEMDRPADALDCLTRALQLDHHAADLHYRMAEVLHLTSELPEAFSHAQLAASLAESSRETGTNTQARLLAAELAYSMLRLQAAHALLVDIAPYVEESHDRFECACLQAELALEAGEARAAERSVSAVRKLDAEHPRSLAIQARLVNLQGDRETAERLLDSALQALDALQPPGGKLPLAERRRLSASDRGCCRAALELGRWREARERSCHRVSYVPREPMAQFQVAQVLVERAEWQNLCQALQVRQHTPGVEALSEEAYRSFEEAIQESERQVQGIGILEGRDGVDLWKDEAWRALYTWRARGMAAFYPSTQTIQALQEAMHSAPPEPDDVAALMMAMMATGEHGRVVQVLREEWLVHSRQPLVMTILALALARLNPRQGVEVAESAITQTSRGGCIRCPEPAMLQFLVAWLAHLAGLHEKAGQFIQKALAAWPEESRWHILAAEIVQAGDSPNTLEVDKSLAHLQQAVSFEPDYAQHHLALGRAYQERGNFQLAIQELDQASRLNPDQGEIWLALAQAQQAIGELEQAAVSTERAIEGSLDSVEPLLLRAELALQTNNPRGALSRAQAALRIQSDHPQALHLLARSLEALNRPDEALAALEKAMPLFNNPLSMQLQRANLLRRSRGLDACLAALQELEAEYPRDPEILALLAEWLLEAGKEEAAVQAAQSALQAGQDKFTRQRRASFHHMIGQYMRRVGQLDQAIHHLNETIGFSPDDLEAYLELGRAYQERRELKQALKVYQRAINLAGGDYRPYYQAGQVLKDSKDYLAAEAMLRKAAQFAPDEVSVHRLLGAVVALNLVHNRRLAPTEAQGT